MMRERYLLRTLFAAALAAVVAGFGAAQDADVVYLEGSPDARPASGARYQLDFGDTLRVGDSVLTGARDFVELQQGAGSTIRVQPETVFSIQERERPDGRRETVMKTAVGAVGFRFNRAVGEAEPLVGTATSVAGVRGTELTIYAGGDGSSLYMVEEGLVEVQASGETVSLGRNEAVQVSATGVAGEKYEWPGRELDFSRWNRQRMDSFLQEPVESARRIRQRLADFQSEIRRMYPEYLELRTQLREARDELSEMESGDASEAELESFIAENVIPVREQTARLLINIRYQALSALSLKGYVLGRMYLELKARNFLTPENRQYRDFLEIYDAIQADFEEFVSPRLGPDDI